MGADPERAPVGVDPTRASIARVYDAALGGRDNYEIDREVLDNVKTAAPEVGDLAVDNREFLMRVCRFLASRAGVRQFIDCGTGLPTAENVHQVVERINPEACVVYVDNDPVVLAHGRALLEGNDFTHFIDADIFKPREVLEHKLVTERIDFTEPIALLHISTLHHFEGPRERPKEIMQEYIDGLPSGSFVVISHFLDPEDEYTSVARAMEEKFRHSPMGSGTFRTLAEIEEFFDGLEMLEPGVTLCAEWWPDGPLPNDLGIRRCVAGGVGRKR